MMRPKSEAELSDMIRAANAPLAIRGGATRGITPKGEPLETGELTGITLYEPGALTMVARAGTPLAQIEAALDAENQMLAFEPFDMAPVTGTSGHSTIGGVFATNASGARRVQVGAARDFLLGVRFVDGTGEAIKNGGRVMKNVTGLDLVKLMSGAHGTLGVLSEVSFKVLPKPETQITLEIDDLTDQQGVAAMTAAMRSPYDVSGAIHLAPRCGTSRTLVRVEGFAESVRYRADQLKPLLAPFGELAETAADPWPAISKLDLFGTPQNALWRVGIRPSNAARLMDGLHQSAGISKAFDWAGGRIWVGAVDEDVNIGALEGPGSPYENLHKLLQETARQETSPTHATLMYAPGAIPAPRFQPDNPAVARISAELRAKFDPRGILNKGLMG